MAVDLRQTHFRFGKDDGTESSHTFWQAEDTNHTQLITGNWTFLLRFTEQELGNTAASNTDAQFQYNKNGAGWVDIGTGTSVVKAVAVGAFANGDNCTKRLSGTGTFESSGAGCTEDGSSGGNANDIVALGNSETECGLQVIEADVANGDTIQFRFRSPDYTVSYDITPTLTIQKPVFEYGAATLSGAGTVTANGKRTRGGAATMTGAGAVASLAGRIRRVAATVAGVGLLACAGTVIPSQVYEYGAATLSGAGSMAVAAVRTRTTAATLAGSGGLAANGNRIRESTATLEGAGWLYSTSSITRNGAAGLTGAGSLAAIGTVIPGVAYEYGAVSFAGTGSLSVCGRITVIPFDILDLGAGVTTDVLSFECLV